MTFNNEDIYVSLSIAMIEQARMRRLNKLVWEPERTQVLTGNARSLDPITFECSFTLVGANFYSEIQSYPNTITPNRVHRGPKSSFFKIIIRFQHSRIKLLFCCAYSSLFAQLFNQPASGYEKEKRKKEMEVSSGLNSSVVLPCRNLSYYSRG